MEVTISGWGLPPVKPVFTMRPRPYHCADCGIELTDSNRATWFQNLRDKFGVPIALCVSCGSKYS